MPASVTVAAANMCWSKPDQRGRVKAYLAYLCQHADIVEMQELRDVELVTQHLLPAGCSTNQDISDAGRRGSCLVWRDSLGEPSSNGITEGARGPHINERWISWIYLLGIVWVAGHAPLRVTGLQWLFIRREKAFLAPRPKVVLGTDANRDISKLGRILGMEAHKAPSDHIIGQLSKGVTVEKVWEDRTGEQQGWTDHPAFFARYATVPAPTPVPAPKPTGGTVATVDKLITALKDQVGYHEGRSGGHWNNIEKYAGQVPGLGWAQGQPWCDVLACWGYLQAGLVGGRDFPVSASCNASAAGYQKMGRWSQYPAVGAQVFFGTSANLHHTGVVVAFDADTITTVEGNTNNTGAAEGDGVYLMTHQRRASNVVGYGYPKFAEGIDSADPKWSAQRPAPTAAANHVTKGRALVTAGVAEFRQSPPTRKAVHLMADAIAEILKKGPKK